MLKKIFKAAKKAAPIIGGGIGFALGGPIGAIIGVLAGGAFDRRSKSKSSFNFNRINNNQKQQIFTLSFIILSAEKFAGTTLEQLGFTTNRDSYGLTPLAMCRGRKVTLNPALSTRVKPDDFVIVAARDSDLESLDTAALVIES